MDGRGKEVMRGRGRRGRRTAAAVAVVLAGVVVAGCGQGSADTDATKDGTPDTPAYARVQDIAESVAPDGTTIRVGSPKADIVVHVYEDMRCPVCGQFETQGGGESLRGLILSGKVRAEYTLASFLDDRVGGQGSRKAANALRAALDAGRFVEYHDALFAHQPEESVDGYTDAFLLEVASRVDGLRGETFDTAVRTMRHGDFVTASQAAYEASGAPGTPTMAVNGKIVGQGMYGGIFDKATLPMVIGAMAAS